MSPVIPVSFEDVSDHYAGNTVVNRMTFVLPSFGAECFAEYVSSRTGAAIKRLNKIIELELAGADKDTIARAVNAMYQTAKRHGGRNLPLEELEEFKRVNGWIEQPAPVKPAEELPAPAIVAEELPARTPEDVYRQAVEVLQLGPIDERAPIVTSDGRYTVDPVTRTIEPVEDIPADIARYMARWEVYDTSLEVWPATFDIPAEYVGVFEVEERAALSLLGEVATRLWGEGVEIAPDKKFPNTVHRVTARDMVGA